MQFIYYVFWSLSTGLFLDYFLIISKMLITTGYVLVITKSERDDKALFNRTLPKVHTEFPVFLAVATKCLVSHLIGEYVLQQNCTKLKC